MKAILVIEMPSKCCNCMFEDGSYCELKEAALDDAFSTKIPNDCHLKLLPRKLDANDWHRMFSGTFSEREAKGYGWNACIDEILGEIDDRDI